MSGFASFASQGGAPPFQVYTLAQQMPKMVFVGTTTVFFAAVNVMKIVPYFMLAQFTAKKSRHFARLAAHSSGRKFLRHMDGQDRLNRALLPLHLHSTLRPWFGAVLAGNKPSFAYRCLNRREHDCRARSPLT